MSLRIHEPDTEKWSDKDRLAWAQMRRCGKFVAPWIRFTTRRERDIAFLLASNANDDGLFLMDVPLITSCLQQTFTESSFTEKGVSRSIKSLKKKGVIEYVGISSFEQTIYAFNEAPPTPEPLSNEKEHDSNDDEVIEVHFSPPSQWIPRK